MVALKDCAVAIELSNGLYRKFYLLLCFNVFNWTKTLGALVETLHSWLLLVTDFVWTYIVVGCCIVAAVFCTLRFRFIQLRAFPHAIELLRGKYSEGSDNQSISTLQALATSLSSTTGIGNIAGVAVAMKVGGPGAIFWMWVMGFLGMALKFSEATLGSYFRQSIDDKGTMVGGPMYYFTAGLGEKWKPVSVFYAACAAIAFLGAWNMFQSNQAASIMHTRFDVAPWLTSALLMVLSALVLVGGIRRIGEVAGRMMPLVCGCYLLGVAVILVGNYSLILPAIEVILVHAFDFSSAYGGAIGIAILWGVRRAVFSNESGVGSAAIAHGAARSQHPVRQGVIASLGPFIDTIVVCTATALVVLMSGFYGTESYRPVSQLSLDFSQQEMSAELSSGESTEWWVVADRVPEPQPGLQKFVSGEPVLAHFSEARESVLPLLDLSSLLPVDAAGSEEIAVKFSLHSEQPVIARLIRLDGGGARIVEVEQTFNHLANKRWQSAILNVSPEIATQWNQTEAVKNHWFVEFETSAPGTVFIDRLVIAQSANGIVLSSAAFASFLGLFGSLFVPIAALFFAYTTIIAGSYFGEVASGYLSRKLIKPYIVLYSASIFVGGVISLDTVIYFSDLSLGLMSVPNLVVIVLLSPLVARESRKYFEMMKKEGNG